MVTIGLKIEEKLKAKLSKIAKRTDRSISSVARLAIEEGLFLFEKGGPHQSKKKLTKVDPTIKP
jgi:predicted transcriptional regulator